MIASIFSDLGGYLHAVFIENLDIAVMIGLIGQALFTARFLVQWLASERAGKSVIPISFWFLSIGGGLLLLAYALYKKDPVFILGQSLGTFIYLRNLMFVFREKKQNS
ncbi:lipid-A-disaccharide synthase N-terminal domain-containing protein [Microvirga sp. W0021]|uniref:Lipid-A-disaccharide synthase N-terminal domain-containing protein n=1 Tax=Hohaiivirga grylli TaxID=3133970 RepID=A0ABV0BIA7_9HYPH